MADDNTKTETHDVPGGTETTKTSHSEDGSTSTTETTVETSSDNS